MDQTDTVDLTGADTYVEAEHPVAGGKWHILPKEDGDVVLYERPNGDRVPAIISADTLRTSPTWTKVD